MTRVGWLDCSSGVSGDMLAGALAATGADVLAAARAVLDVIPDAGRCSTERVTRGGLHAVRFVTDPAADQPLRRLADIRAILDRVALADATRRRAVAVFDRLAAAEAAVHGVGGDEVHFHEVGALDTIIDVVTVCHAVDALRLDRLVTSPVALGGGTVMTEHGAIPLPGPAVLELMRNTHLVGVGGPVDVELATPTGVALLAELSDATGPLPAVQVDRVGVGAGSGEMAARPNVVRLVVGDADDTADERWQLIEANVDDLDPRLWPGVLDRLLAAGAADAWLTPIVMKKGRPAHTVSVQTEANAAAAVRDTLFRETSTIGVRTTIVTKQALARSWLEVAVDGQAIRVKVASLNGEVVNVAAEWEDVASAAAALRRPAKTVLAAAIAAAHAQLP